VQHPFNALLPDYTACLQRMTITRAAQVDATAKRLIGFIDAGHYKTGCDETDVPQIVAAASFELEASSNFNLNPAQGWPLHQKSRDVPYNGPFDDWTTAQVAAYKIDGLDKVGAANWSWEQSCYEEESFNGFGYRAHGVHSPYLWAGTSIYTRSKYDADGDWDPNAIDEQLGVIPVMFRIVQLRPDLALPVPFPAHSTALPPIPAPVPIGVHDAEALQNALNALGADPQLTVDGNYGRHTRIAVIAFQKSAGIAADGFAGPDTWTAITLQLSAQATHASPATPPATSARVARVPARALSDPTAPKPNLWEKLVAERKKLISEL
jgi:lysozyme family protein